MFTYPTDVNFQKLQRYLSEKIAGISVFHEIDVSFLQTALQDAKDLLAERVTLALRDGSISTKETVMELAVRQTQIDVFQDFIFAVERHMSDSERKIE